MRNHSMFGAAICILAVACGGSEGDSLARRGPVGGEQPNEPPNGPSGPDDLTAPTPPPPPPPEPPPAPPTACSYESSFQEMAAAPLKAGQAIYALARAGNVLTGARVVRKSVDGGKTFTNLTLSFNPQGCSFVPVAGELAASCASGNTNVLYVSSGGGATWAMRGNATNVQQIIGADSVHVEAARWFLAHNTPGAQLPQWAVQRVTSTGSKILDRFLPAGHSSSDATGVAAAGNRIVGGGQGYLAGNQGGGTFYVRLSDDSGATWSTLATVSRPSTVLGWNAPTVSAAPNGDIFVFSSMRPAGSPDNDYAIQVLRAASNTLATFDTGKGIAQKILVDAQENVLVMGANVALDGKMTAFVRVHYKDGRPPATISYKHKTHAVTDVNFSQIVDGAIALSGGGRDTGSNVIDPFMVKLSCK